MYRECKMYVWIELNRGKGKGNTKEYQNNRNILYVQMLNIFLQTINENREMEMN